VAGGLATQLACGFEAARQLSGQAAGHRAGRLHGHSFWASVGCVLPTGWAAFPGAEVQRLRAELERALGQLDYRLLNEQLPQPSDTNLARWLQHTLQHGQQLPGLQHIALQSTAQGGVELEAAGQAQVWRRYIFQSAHRLPNVPAGHKCGRMHGHGFEVVLHARQEAQGSVENGVNSGVDGDRLDAVWAPIQAELDHACLNDIAGLNNPTSEMLSSWLWQRIQPELSELTQVTVFETASCGARFDGRHYRIWKDFTLDSAVQLKRAPDGSAQRRLHGHTYTLRLHLSAPLDQVMGWTVDFGDVKEIFKPIFNALDHQPLYELAERAGLADCDTASLAAWILRTAQAQLPQLSAVDLLETRGCGATVSLAGDALARPE
jgi:6-pyruvoyltetrahydropterin/6-carboxytetrahydropterin synthase